MLATFVIRPAVFVVLAVPPVNGHLAAAIWENVRAAFRAIPGTFVAHQWIQILMNLMMARMMAFLKTMTIWDMVGGGEDWAGEEEIRQLIGISDEYFGEFIGKQSSCFSSDFN